MRVRRSAGLLLLALVAISTFEVALDASADQRSSRQHQWRVRAAHAAPRAPQRSATAAADVDPPGAPLVAGALVSIADGHAWAAPVPASVFVPPRV